MAEQRSLTALQPFLALANSAIGRAAADLVMQATQAPGCYVFSELLETPSIQTNISNLPQLNDKHLEKLKQLSLVTIASKGPKHLTYASLQQTLDLPSVRALEDLVISAIYNSLLSAKLDTKHQRVDVSSTAGRDVAPQEIPQMIEVLSNWCKQCEDVLDDIDEQIKSIHRDAIAKKKEADEYERALAVRREAIKAEEKGVSLGTTGGKGKRVISEGADEGAGRGGWIDDDEMDLDEGPFGDAHGVGAANTSRRRSKGGRFGHLIGGNKRR
ncbi:hypothetical protein RUND412_003107 [Rhizina undulata]